MFSTVLSATMFGMEVEFVHIEADVSDGLPTFHLVGYLSSEVKEASERVRAAIRNSGFRLPAKKMVINLSPANIRKRGTLFDLGIALSILVGLGELPQECIYNKIFVGELSLDGKIKPVNGILPIVLAAKKKGYPCCIVPEKNRKEGELVEGIQVIGVANLREAYEIVRGEKKASARENTKEIERIYSEEFYEDFSDIKGQSVVKRATEIAVAGSHNLLMIGNYGAGKTTIAKRIPSILPPLTREESLELTQIYSIIGEIEGYSPLITKRPFREVNPTVTKSTLLGGGAYPRPGEISRAHKGVLFLDEVAEFPRHVLECLRKPLEESKIRIMREKGEYEFPADFLLVAAMNPCPCGQYPDRNKCNCTSAQIRNYLGKLSRPFLDRIDMCVEVEKVLYDDLVCGNQGETSAQIRERILMAREIQRTRFASLDITTNSQIKMQYIEEYCMLTKKQKEMMEQAYGKLGLTARSYHKVLCVARTIADLAESSNIADKHLREALAFRMFQWFQEDRL